MSFTTKKRYLSHPPFCESVETFICPIAKSKDEAPNGLKIGGGWRYFDQLRVIQKIDTNSYIETIMKTSSLLKAAKLSNSKALNRAELQLENITKDRHSFLELKMSQPHIMGVINLTPDSFYNKSQTKNLGSIYKKCKTMISQGASIIDFGGESSRPGSKRISHEEEKSRIVEPIQNFNKEKSKCYISLDTRNLSTMKIGFENGVHIINDITGFNTKEKIQFISKSQLHIVVMHMQNSPETMQLNPKYTFAPIDIYKFFLQKIKTLLNEGIELSKIVIDPGIGFGKNKLHNLDLFKYLTLFHNLGVPILIGVSRKSLIRDLILEDYTFRGINKREINPSKRLSGSIAFAMHCYNSGIQIIRAHDVFETRQAIICQKALD